MKIYKVMTIIGLFILNITAAYANCYQYGSLKIINKTTGSILVQTDADCICSPVRSVVIASGATQTLNAVRENTLGSGCYSQGSSILFHLYPYTFHGAPTEIAEVSLRTNGGDTYGKVTTKNTVPGWELIDIKPGGCLNQENKTCKNIEATIGKRS